MSGSQNNFKKIEIEKEKVWLEWKLKRFIN